MSVRRIALLALWAVVIGASIGAIAATEPTGMVRLCRETDLLEPTRTNLASAFIRLPTGLLLQDYGQEDDSDPLAHKWPMTIITLKPAEMRPHVRCAVVPAVLSPLSRVRSVAPADHRYLEIVGLVTPDGREETDPDFPRAGNGRQTFTPLWRVSSNSGATNPLRIRPWASAAAPPLFALSNFPSLCEPRLRSSQ